MTDSGADPAADSESGPDPVPDPDRSGIRGTLDGVGTAIDEDELTPELLKLLVAITFGLLAVFGIVSYLIVFVYLGF